MIRLRVRWLGLGLLFLPLLVSCGGQATMPQPRSVIIYSGERIRPDAERMSEVDTRLREQLEHIETSPDFLIRVERASSQRYPWDVLEIQGDTAEINASSVLRDADAGYLVYAHLRLAQEMGDLGRWLPEGEGLEGFELEKAILEYLADVWLLGRSVYDTQAYGPLDEILYSHRFGYLDDFIIATQGERFSEARDQRLSEFPESERDFSEWFERTFERVGPGFLSGPDEEEDPEDDAPEEPGSDVGDPGDDPEGT